MQKAFKYRSDPPTEQESLSRQTIDCVRLIDNKALDPEPEAWSERQERVDYNQTTMLTSWTQESTLKILHHES
jgi:putative transposase